MLFLKKIIKKYKYIKKKFYLKIFKLLFQYKEGIEFGGPTNLVEKPHYEFQLYNFLVLDGANLSEENYFQENLEKDYKYGNKIGKQFIADVTKITDLERINKKYYSININRKIHKKTALKLMKDYTLMQDKLRKTDLTSLNQRYKKYL